MARYLQTTVNLGTVFQKNFLEAFEPKKSSFTVGRATLLQPEGLENTFSKNCSKVNCWLQMSRHCKKLERKISKTLGEDTFCVFYFRIFNVNFFYETKSGIYFYQRSVIIVSYFELLCNYPKRPQRKNYEIHWVNRFSKFYFIKMKTVWTPPLKK